MVHVESLSSLKFKFCQDSDCKTTLMTVQRVYIFSFESMRFVCQPPASGLMCLLACQLAVLSLRRQSRSLLRLLLLYFIILSTQFEVQTSVGDKAKKDIRQATRRQQQQSEQ